MNRARRLRGYQELVSDDLARRLLETPTGLPRPTPEIPAAGRARRRFAWWTGVSLSLVSIVIGLALAGSIGYFYWRSQAVGDELTSEEQHAIASQGADCAQPAPLSDSLQAEGLLQAPTIGLNAPIVEGTGNAQLDVAVGHETGTSQPGTAGTDVLAAHDVTWFSEIDHLHAGDTISYKEPCQTFHYVVTGAQVVRTGTPIPPSTGQTLALVTCYPLNALFVTPQRYLVGARLVSTTTTHGRLAAPPSLPPAPTISAPAALVAQNLSLANNNVPLGTLGLSGSPSPTWQQSVRPIQTESSVLKLYFAALRAAEQHQASWWHQLAPNVPFLAALPLYSASVSGEGAHVQPTIDVVGDHVTGATLTSQPTLKGGLAPATYRLTMSATVQSGTLVISGWQLQRIP
jgi:sortase A